jgi:hypothetical protein
MISTTESLPSGFSATVIRRPPQKQELGIIADLRLDIRLPITDRAITITYWKEDGDDPKASVSMWTRGRERRLSDISINSFRQWGRCATRDTPARRKR